MRGQKAEQKAGAPEDACMQTAQREETEKGTRRRKTKDDPHEGSRPPLRASAKKRMRQRRLVSVILLSAREKKHRKGADSPAQRGLLALAKVADSPEFNGNISFFLVLESNCLYTGDGPNNGGLPVSDMTDGSKVDCCLGKGGTEEPKMKKEALHSTETRL